MKYKLKYSVPNLFIEILQEVSNGKQLTEVAKIRDLDYKKIANNMQTIKGRFEASSTTHLIAILIRKGIIQ